MTTKQAETKKERREKMQGNNNALKTKGELIPPSFERDNAKHEASKVRNKRRRKQAENYKNQYSQYESGFTELIPPTQNRGESKKEAATKLAQMVTWNGYAVSNND